MIRVRFEVPFLYVDKMYSMISFLQTLQSSIRIQRKRYF